MVRSVARRGCIFDFLIGTKDNVEKEGRRKCDVVMNGQVVSFGNGSTGSITHINFINYTKLYCSLLHTLEAL